MTKEERSAVRTLERLAKRWPKSLWLFSANGSLNVMRYRGGAEVVTDRGGMDPTESIATIDIPNGGGDW